MVVKLVLDGDNTAPVRPSFLAWCERVGLDPSRFAALTIHGECLTIEVTWAGFRRRTSDSTDVMWDRARDTFVWLPWLVDVAEPPPPDVLACASPVAA